MAIRYPLVLNGNTIEELQPADSIDFTSASISGDLTFTGTGARIKANFSDPIATNRLLFQTSTANSTTLVGIMPNGTGSTSGIYGVNSSTLTNASYFDLRVSGSDNDVRLTSDYYGAGTYLPITFYTGGAEQVRIDTSGNVGIGTISPGARLNVVAASASDALRITQTGAGNALVVEDSANPDSTPFIVDASGKVAIGATTATENLNLVADGRNFLQLTRASTDANQSVVSFRKARGTNASPLVVVSGDSIGDTQFFGYDGTAYIQAAAIVSSVDGTPGTNDMPGRLVFSTTADGASTPTERMRIDNAGRVGIGRTPGNDGTLYITGSPVNAYSYNINNTPTYGSTVTAEGVGYLSTINTAATAFTLNAVQNFRAAQGTKGAGSIITNLFGFQCDPLTNGTNNFGFYSAVASGSGRWNFYAAGTADNYFAGKVGVNVLGSLSGIANALPITGGTVAQGYRLESAVQSDVTTTARGYVTFLSTQAAAFTVGTVSHFQANQSTVGASSAITFQIGFEATSSLVGATNNFGFYSNIPSASGRYNFYAAGTADNYFAGRLLLGSAASVTTRGNDNNFQLQGIAYTQASATISRFNSGSTGGSGLEFNRSRSGSLGGNTVVLSNDTLGEVYFNGADGTGFIPAASVTGAVDGTPGTNDMPGRLVFSTTADGAPSPTERLRIDSAGQVGIGGAPAAGRNLAVSKNITGAVTSRGITSIGQIQSDVTAVATYFATSASTSATAFTLTNLMHYQALQGSFGAGSTITNQYGFAADSSLTGATNNFGFHSNIPSGSGRYNFYAAGNASNYFAGNVGIGGDASVALETFASATNWVRNNSAAGIPIFAAYRSNGTLASKTVVSSGDEAGRFDVRGFDGTNFIQLAQINFHVDGTPGTNDMPGRIVFQTTADGASSPTERMRISNAGNVGIGQTSPASRLHVRQDQDGTTRTIIQNRNGSGTPLSELTFITSAFDFSDNRYAYIQSGGGSSTYLSFGTCNASTPTERMQIAANGYVGIGTAPAAPFHVQTAVTSSTAIIANTGGTECFFILRNSVTTSNNTRIGAISADLTLTTGGTERVRVTSTGNIHGTSGTTAMTDGFFYIPSAAGAPSGVPTAIAGRVPMYYDTTNNNFYVYNGAWKKVLLA